MKEKYNIEKQYAFTLAEVLITLGIIGVVAALTIPNLIANYQKKVTVERLKVDYSVLSQAVKMSEADNGDLSTWDIPNVGWDSSTYQVGKVFAEQYILKYLKYVDICNVSSEKCWAKKYYLLDKQINYYASASSNKIFAIRLENGSVIGFWPRNNLVEVYIDINGKKGPNLSGKDWFDIIILKKALSGIIVNMKEPGVYFYGQGRSRNDLMTTGYPCAKNGGLAGVYCGALIMYDGWQISDDYPW